MSNSKELRNQAAAAFKKDLQQRVGAHATADHDAGLKAIREKTSRLKALRLAKEAADRASAEEGAASAGTKPPK